MGQGICNGRDCRDGAVVASGMQPLPNLNDVRGDEVTAQGLRACARPRPIRLARV